jgi:hypothetical protein
LEKTSSKREYMDCELAVDEVFVDRMDIRSEGWAPSTSPWGDTGTGNRKSGGTLSGREGIGVGGGTGCNCRIGGRICGGVEADAGLELFEADTSAYSSIIRCCLSI